jgi:hypothetical protein
MAGAFRVCHYQTKASGAKEKQPSPGARLVWKESRCPGCYGRVSVKYQLEKVRGKWKYTLLTPSIAHPLCELALERIRRTENDV